MSKLQIFNNKELGKIRALKLDNKEYVVASDVAKALMLKNPYNCIVKFCENPKYYDYREDGRYITKLKLIGQQDVKNLINTNKSYPDFSKQPELIDKVRSWIFAEIMKPYDEVTLPFNIIDEEPIINPNKIQTIGQTQEFNIDSRDIAEWTGKEHKNILVDIRNEIEALEEIGRLIFQPSSYINSQAKSQPCYKMNRDGAMQLALKYDAIVRYKVIQKLNSIEQGNNLPKNYKEALLCLVQSEEEKEKLLFENSEKQKIIETLTPKATYYDMILQSESVLPISIIAKDYGMSAIKFNELLHNLGVQYKMQDTWLLYAEHQDKGYTQTKTYVVSEEKTQVHMYWTQKGRIFLYNLLKTKRQAWPLIEKQQYDEFWKVNR